MKDLMLNMLIIILPIFVYQTFWIDKASSPMVSSSNRTAISILAAVAALCCMLFPVHPHPGYVFDLRLVPLLMGILYGGFRASLLIISAVYLYSWQIGGIGFVIVALTYPAAIIASFLLAARFKLWERRRKLAAASLLSFLSALLVNTVVVLTLDEPFFINPHLPVFAAYVILHGITMWIAVYLIENMREKAALRFEIQQAEKLRIMGQLAASIAHEVRNPMTVVRGFLQLLQSDQIPSDKRQMFLKLGIEELDRSESIISNYLAFARPQSTRIEAVDAAERVEHAAGIISSYATLRNVEINTLTTPGLFIEADPEQLSQVLMNLIKNGIEAMQQGGVLTITVAAANDGTARIEVADTGVGMTPDETSRLGNPFFSTKQDGTGLGIMVTYQIIHSMNGKIHVESEKGSGTRFIITLPRKSDLLAGRK
ncbi:ATP-binding protein [Tumebacillus avium]|uniref:ATP-binding protein n=1 Tax=Tumebacillus avium TaxID=1903704 RepID=UPI001E3DD7B2|nr:ATP-binding protein [Tumebacillus avium]